MGGGGGRINKPRSAASRKTKGPKTSQARSAETLKDTTLHKLKQCRSNPHANVRLSGKKKRLLMKEAKRIVAEQAKMQVGVTKGRSSTDGVPDSTTCNNVTEAMDNTVTQT